jgi:predicted N-acetyltransferase YhbS
MNAIVGPTVLTRFAVAQERREDGVAVDAIVTAAFGPGRFARTAERLREGSAPVAGFVGHEGGQVIGSVRLWPILVGDTGALFLGPIAVDAARRSAGLGRELVQACIDHARITGAAGILLVGDRAYFEPFGFTPAEDAILPGPVDRARVLWFSTGSEPISGRVTIRR